LPVSCKYGKGFGSFYSANSTLNGANASKVTIHGDIEVPKFLPLKGPKG